VTPTIRRARPDDAGFIAWTILMSQRGHRPRGWFDIALNRPEPECLAFIRCIAAGPALSLWHVSQFWIAEVESLAAAALCAVPAGTARTTTRPAIKDAMLAMGVDADEQAAIWRRGAYIARCWTPGDDGNWLIEHVAAKPSHRGRGLVQALLTHALAEGRAAGFARASIPFYIGNDAAERCYAKARFAFAEEKRDPAFEALTGAPGFRRFERAI
jgi:ribosomal protein S18 acetylase RimI-like enzyme